MKKSIDITTIKFIESQESYLVNGVQFINKKGLDMAMKQAGIDPKFFPVLKSSTVSFEETLCKAGTKYVDTKTGLEGTYGENNGGKDWTKMEKLELELGALAIQSLSFASFQQAA